ncbi:hypothetical protein [Corynebacterium glutamicum]|uniref:hypothetical protein n=1 Tax=Corynebacterium glutamicum TaxID=1718 RepID=UPI0011786E38|nr:hypothetical protein [Corynebacterium glutamicum]
MGQHLSIHFVKEHTIYRPDATDPVNAVIETIVRLDRQFRTIMDSALHSEDPDHGLPHNQD